MYVHAGTVISHNRLRHEGRSFAVGVGYVMHAVFQYLHLVGFLHQGAEAGTDLTLSGGGNLVVMHFNIQAHLFHGRAHGGANIVQRIDRRYREVAAFNARAMAGVAVFKAVV